MSKGAGEGLMLYAAVTSKKEAYAGALSLQLIEPDRINFEISELVSIDFTDFPTGDDRYDKIGHETIF